MVRLGKFPDEAKKLELIYRPCVGGEPGLDRRQKRRRRRCRRDVKPKLLPELTVDDVRNLVDGFGLVGAGSHGPVVQLGFFVVRLFHRQVIGVAEAKYFLYHF